MMKILEIMLIIVIGLPLGYLSLLSSRDALCDDIRESTGKNLFQNKRKKHKKYPNRFKSFFLLAYLPHIRKWHYVCFILDTFLTIVFIMALAFRVIYGPNPVLFNILVILVLLTALNKLMMTLFPWGRYRP